MKLIICVPRLENMHIMQVTLYSVMENYDHYINWSYLEQKILTKILALSPGFPIKGSPTTFNYFCAWAKRHWITQDIVDWCSLKLTILCTCTVAENHNDMINTCNWGPKTNL